MNKSKLAIWGVLLASVAILLALDLILKSWAVSNLMGQPGRDLIPGFLGLTFTRNTGAAFGLFANQDWGRWVLTGVKIVLMLSILWYYHRLPLESRNWALRVPMILILAGGLGNLYDRIVLGYVRDMLAFLFVDFPIFNLADIFVVVGCFAGAFVLLFVVKDLP